MINKIQIYEKLNKPKKSFEIYNHKALYAVIASEGIRTLNFNLGNVM